MYHYTVALASLRTFTNYMYNHELKVVEHRNKLRSVNLIDLIDF